MATVRWTGQAPRIAQVQDYVFAGTWEASDIVTLTQGNVTVSVTAGSTTTSTVVDNVVSAWNALSETVYPSFAEITASRSSNTLRLTADNAGRAFSCTVATTETGGGGADAQTIDGGASSAGASTTANSGPNDWSAAANWSGNAVPVDTNDVVIDRPAAIKYGFAQTGVTLASLYLAPGFEGTDHEGTRSCIGLPQVNEDNATIYVEYRATHLAIKATVVTIDCDVGLLRLDQSTAQTTGHVYRTGTGEEDGLEALCWKGTHSSNVLNVRGQSQVGIAPLGAEVATVATLNVHGGAVVRAESGVTLTTVNNDGGEVQTNSAITTLTQTDGTFVVRAGAVTTLNLRGGTVFYDGTGTLGTATVADSGVLDFGRDDRATTVSNPVDLHGEQCQVLDPFKRTGSLVVDFNQGANQSQVDWGRHVRLTRGTPA